MQLILPLERDEDPLTGGVKIQMANLITEASGRSNRKPVRQHAVLVAENLQRARIFGLHGCRSVSASDEKDGLAGRVRAYLVAVDADIEGRRGLYLRADGSVRQDPMDRQSARIVRGSEHMCAVDIGSDEDRA